MEKNNTKQSDLAKFLDISRQAVAQYKDGKAQPNIEMIVNIAEYFNVSSDYLLGITNVHTNDKDLKFVCEYTGLNEDAIENIKDITKTEEDAYFLNLFLYLQDLKRIIKNISLLSEYNSTLDSLYKEYEKQLSCELNISSKTFNDLLEKNNASTRMFLSDYIKIIIDETNPNDNNRELFYNTENARAYTLYRINTYFSSLIDDILLEDNLIKEK